MKYIYVFLLILSFFSGCSNIPDVTLYDDPELSERAYSLKQGSREIEWVVNTDGGFSGVISHRAAWGGPVSESVPWMKKILGRILQDYEKQFFNTLLIGRMLHAFGDNNTEISERFMMAVKESGRWDPVKGKALSVSSYETGLFAELCDINNVYKEFKETFSEYGMKLRSSYPEKVLISKVKDISTSDNILKKHPVLSSEDRLPFDYIVWLNISAE